MQPPIPSWPELERARAIFEAHEGRDAMYRVARHLLSEGEWWGDHELMVDLLNVLLLTWNGAFYRYGSLDEKAVQAYLSENWSALSSYRIRSIRTLTSADEQVCHTLFSGFMRASRIANGSCAGRESPVSAAKALHVLAPEFSPLWDKAIADRYGCRYWKEPVEAYARFMKISQHQVERLEGERPGATDLLKRLDEHNYVRYSKQWWEEDER